MVVTVRDCDGRVLALSAECVRGCELLTTMLECCERPQSEPIAIPAADGVTLRLIDQWYASHQTTHDESDWDRYLRQRAPWAEVDPGTRAFFEDMPIQQVYLLAIAADFLAASEMYDVACKRLGTMLATVSGSLSVLVS